MKIELILLGIIGVVFLIDFLMKGVKKKTESNDMVKADEEEVNIPKQRKGRYIYYLYAFVGSIIIGIISTYLIDYFYSGRSLEKFIYDFTYSLASHITNFTISFGITLIFIGFVLYKKNGFLKKILVVRKKLKERTLFQADLGEHIDLLFEQNLSLFIPAIIIPSLIVWYFNDKIKAR